MSRKKIGIAAGSVVAAGAIIAAGAAIATAADAPTPLASPSGAPAPDPAGRGPGGQHTAASADQTAKVKAAVKAKDSAVTVTEVVKDADGSFDARGTKAGAPIHFDVSADYKTVTEGEGRPGGPGGPGRAMGTAVTGTELAKVTAAVKAKDSAVSVTEVRKSPDGAYHAFGTKAGARVMVEVSKDLKTVTVRTGGPGGGHGPGGPGGAMDTPVTGTEAAKVTAAVKAKDSAVTVTSVRKDPDGSYDALGTKAGADVMVEVSKDLKTVTVRTGGPGGPGHGGPGGPPPGAPAPAPSATTS